MAASSSLRRAASASGSKVITNPVELGSDLLELLVERGGGLGHLRDGTGAGEGIGRAARYSGSAVLPDDLTPTPPYASWISRVGALLIDGIVYLGVVFAVIAALVATNLAEDDAERLEEGELGDAWVALLYAGFLLGPLVYSTLMHGAYGKTLGKMALGIRVVRDDDLGSIGYGRALGRALAVLVLGVVPFAGILDGLWPLWDARNQALHDKIASTVVVRS